MIQSIDHIVLTTRDLDKCIAFYTGALGMQLERAWTELTTFIQFHPDALDEAARRIDEFRAKLRP